MELKDIEAKMQKIAEQIETFLSKYKEEIAAVGSASTETKQALTALGDKWNGLMEDFKARVTALEQAWGAPRGGAVGNRVKSIGELVVEHESFKSVQQGRGSTGKILVGDIKTAIVNATGQNQPLVPDYRVPGIMQPTGLRRFTIRQLMPNLPVSSNLVQFTRELVFTNSAGPQTGGSPNAGENVAKPESAITFELANAAVQTLAHWIPASRQILDDAPALMGYINSRLMYGLKLAEESQLLDGDNTNNNLDGLIKNATAFDTTLAGSTASDTFIDVIRKAITQVADSYFEASGVILHPRDWETIQLTKTTGTASSGEYIFSNPHTVETDRIWGLPVVPTPAMTRGQFMVGAFDQAAALWDRNDATIEVSREHSDYFVKNMVAILCEERLALTVFRPKALIYGGFPYGS